MANRRTWIIAATGAAVVAATLAVGGMALTTSGMFGGSDVEAIVEEPRWEEPAPGVGPGPESGEPTVDGMCWVFSGGGWLGTACPPGADG